jgi:hypothetical protein
MNARLHFSYEPDWRDAPLAFWVHHPMPDAPSHFEPQAPNATPHMGFRFLRFEFDKHELVFSSPSQLEHFIAVLNTKPLPTTRQLSAKRMTSAGPNGHWLSRLPAQLKGNRPAIPHPQQTSAPNFRPCCQRCGSNSSIRLLGQVGSFSITSLR